MEKPTFSTEVKSTDQENLKEPEKIDPKKFNVKKIITITLTSLLVVLLFEFISIALLLRQQNNNQNVKPLQTKSTESKDISGCTKNNSENTYTEINKDKNKTLIISRTNKTNKKSTNYIVTGIPDTGYNTFEMGNCYVYVIKTSGKSVWELWKYDFYNNGEIIYKGNIFQFKVNKQETLIALINSNSNKEYINIFDIKSHQKLLTLSAEDIKNNTGNKISKDVLNVAGSELIAWNSRGNEIWGSLWAAALVEAFWKLNTDTKKLDVFTELNKPTLNGDKLNPDEEIYAYTDKPAFFDTDSYNAWKEKTKTYSINIYSLRSKSSTKIDTLPSSWPGGMSTPILGWDTPTSLRYSTPNGEKNYRIR